MAGKICPFWVGYLLINPLRRLIQNPDRILGLYIKPGMTVLDIGCGMGYFTLPLAEMVGSTGRVVGVEIQEKMIRALQKRALKAGVSDRIITRMSTRDSLGLNEFKDKLDFAVAFAVVHEVPNVPAFFGEVWTAMKAGGRCLVAEPAGHVSLERFKATVAIAEDKGFVAVATPEIVWSHAVLLEKR